MSVSITYKLRYGIYDDDILLGNACSSVSQTSNTWSTLFFPELKLKVYFILAPSPSLPPPKHIIYSIPLPEEIIPMLRYTGKKITPNFSELLASCLKIIELDLNSEKIWREALRLKTLRLTGMAGAT